MQKKCSPNGTPHPTKGSSPGATSNNFTGPTTLRSLHEALKHEVTAVLRQAGMLVLSVQSSGATAAAVTGGAFVRADPLASSVVPPLVIQPATDAQQAAPSDVLLGTISTVLRKNNGDVTIPTGVFLNDAMTFLGEIIAKLPPHAVLTDGSPSSQLIMENIITLLKTALLYFLADEELAGQSAASASAANSMMVIIANAVVKLSTLGIDCISTPRNLAAAHQISQLSRATEQEVRCLSMFLLGAVAQKHADSLTACWPSLFPDVSIAALLGSSTPRHPLLTPLLHDKTFRVRAAASSCVTQLLQKSSSYLQIAVESPKGRQSFSSLSTRLGRVLNDLHEVLVHAFTSKECQAVRALFLTLGGSLVAVTPYSSCKQCLDILIHKILPQPLMIDFLSKGEGNDFVCVCTFLNYLWKAKPLYGPLTDFLQSGKGTGSSLVNALMNALPAAEATKSLVALARSYPQVITSTHLAQMLQAAEASLAGPAHPTKDVSLQEALRALMHYSGLSWEAFAEGGDGTAQAAEVLGQEVDGDVPVHSRTASTEDKHKLFALYFKALSHSNSSVRCVAYKCIAQIGEDFVASLPDAVHQDPASAPPPKQAAWGAKAPAAVTKKTFVELALVKGLQERDNNCYCEALITLGVWTLKYPSLLQFHDMFLKAASKAMVSRASDGIACQKASFVLSNIASQTLDENSPCRRDTDLMLLLCDCAAFAASVTKSKHFCNSLSTCSSIAGHSVRMMHFLLKALDESTLIAELEGHPEGVANYFLETLADLVLSPSFTNAQRGVYETKTRWNAAHAIGEAVSRREVYQADPPASRKCFHSLLGAIETDTNFKVRSRAVNAVSKIVLAYCGRGTPQAPLSKDERQQRNVVQKEWEEVLPQALQILCNALETLSQQTQSFVQYKEASVLRNEIVQGLRVLLDAAPCTERFQTSMKQNKSLLVSEGLWT